MSIELVNLRVETWTGITVWSHILVKAIADLMVVGWHHGWWWCCVQQLCRWEFLVVFVVVEIECWRSQGFVSSEQASVATVYPHVTVEISRLWEAQKTKLALIRFFTTGRMISYEISIWYKVTFYDCIMNNALLLSTKVFSARWKPWKKNS